MSERVLRVGDSASVERIFADREVRQFADLSLDTNPIHLDQAAAEESLFGQRVVHGMLVASLFSGLLGNELPGKGTIYLGQTISFKAPVFLGDQITASVEIIELRDDKPIAKLRTYCVNQNGIIVIDGEAIVKFA